MNSKKTLLILLLAFFTAGVWQRDTIMTSLRGNIDLSWLSFKQEDFAAARTNYMEKKKGGIKIALVPPKSTYVQERALFDKMERGVKIAATETREKNNSVNNLDYLIAPNREKLDTLDEYIYELGTDPSVLAMVLPTSQKVTQQTETLAEYMGMVTFRTTHLFIPREEESYLVFNNTYPVNLYSKIIAKYARKRDLQSVAMITENTPRDNGFTRNVETWLAKQNVPVTTALTFRKEMINISIFREFEKKFGVFGVDGVFWGMMGDSHMRFISDLFTEKPELLKSADHIMFLPIAPDNIERIDTLLQSPELVGLDPVIAYPEISESPLREAFDKLYFTTYGEKANHAAYYGYDTYMLIANAVENCITLSPQAIAKYLEENSFQGILVDYAFDKDGQLRQGNVNNVIKLGKIVNGKIIKLHLDDVQPLTDRNKLWEKHKFSVDN